MDYKYKINDKVRVRKDLDSSYRYRMVSGPGAGKVTDVCTKEMLLMAGKLVTIYRYGTGGKYIIKEDNDAFYWTDEMFDGGNPLFHGFF